MFWVALMHRINDKTHCIVGHLLLELADFLQYIFYGPHPISDLYKSIQNHRFVHSIALVYP